jgi:hypothetical protein
MYMKVLLFCCKGFEMMEFSAFLRCLRVRTLSEMQCSNQNE